MKFPDYQAKGFFYNGGNELAEVGTILLHSATETYLKIVRIAETDEVMLEESSGALHEPDHDYLAACIIPRDPAKIPHFSR
jgi:hypothetical protein